MQNKTRKRKDPGCEYQGENKRSQNSAYTGTKLTIETSYDDMGSDTELPGYYAKCCQGTNEKLLSVVLVNKSCLALIRDIYNVR